MQNTLPNDSPTMLGRRANLNINTIAKLLPNVANVHNRGVDAKTSKTASHCSTLREVIFFFFEFYASGSQTGVCEAFSGGPQQHSVFDI